jgi:hypothetical protein
MTKEDLKKYSLQALENWRSEQQYSRTWLTDLERAENYCVQQLRREFPYEGPEYQKRCQELRQDTLRLYTEQTKKEDQARQRYKELNKIYMLARMNEPKE